MDDGIRDALATLRSKLDALERALDSNGSGDSLKYRICRISRRFERYVTAKELADMFHRYTIPVDDPRTKIHCYDDDGYKWVLDDERYDLAYRDGVGLELVAKDHSHVIDLSTGERIEASR